MKFPKKNLIHEISECINLFESESNADIELSSISCAKKDQPDCKVL